MPDDATSADLHVCKPGASLHYCPTSGECDQTDLHQPLVPCAGAVLKQAHARHSWEPQPSTPLVHCNGTTAPRDDTPKGTR